MAYEIKYSDEAVEDLKKIRAFDRAAILDEIEHVLGVNPTLESKAKVKQLRQPAPSQYRLRVADFRIFYDVKEIVQIVRILSKEDTIRYLEKKQ
jgi:addiction module RelE/StbE family toxin